MNHFEHETAVVTGGGSGIGRGIALALAAEGMNVVVADIEADSAAQVAREAERLGVDALAFRVDVTDRRSLADLADAVDRRFGGCRVLSNNAGVAFQGDLCNATEQDWQWVMSVNLHGLVNACAAFVDGMRAQKGESHIVNNASMAGLVALDFLRVGVYTASKYAAVGFTESLRAELAADGIGVSALCPGMVRSNLSATSARNRPARFGGPLPEPEAKLSAELEAVMIEPETVGRLVVRGIRENRAYIVTHPEAKALVEARFAAVLADFDAAVRD